MPSRLSTPRPPSCPSSTAVAGDTTPSMAEASSGSSRRWGPSRHAMSTSSASRVRRLGTIAMSSNPYARRAFLPRPISISNPNPLEKQTRPCRAAKGINVAEANVQCFGSLPTGPVEPGRPTAPSLEGNELAAGSLRDGGGAGADLLHLDHPGIAGHVARIEHAGAHRLRVGSADGETVPQAVGLRPLRELGRHEPRQ